MNPFRKKEVLLKGDSARERKERQTRKKYKEKKSEKIDKKGQERNT